MRKTFVILTCFLFVAIGLYAEPTLSKQGFFRPIAWNQSLWADVHPNLIRMDLASATTHPEYDWEKSGLSHKMYSYLTLGFNIPFWNQYWINKKYEIALAMPVSFSLWLDMFQPTTAPVVDTDYRIGMPDIAFIQRFKNKNFIQNYSLRFSPFKHESTHIGDELTIMRKNAELPITRVNVSYNYAEIVATLNDAESSLLQNHCFRIGLMLSYSKSWYTMYEGDGDATKITPKHSPFETYLQYQYQTPQAKCYIQGVFSAEIRNRMHYGYPTYTQNADGSWTENLGEEKRTWTFNAFAGICYHHPKNIGYFSKIGIGLRAYHGICPYGQFRSIQNYHQYGLCILFE